MKILIQLLVQNNEKWISHLHSMITALGTDIEFTTWIYENDSTDNTVKELNKNRNFWNLHIKSYGNKFNHMFRTQRIAHHRNQFKKFLSTKYDKFQEFDYVIVMDSEIFFNKTTLEKMIETMTTTPDVHMVCPHGLVMQSLPCHFHYDTWATLTTDNQRCGQFTNILECTHQGAKHDRHCHCVGGEPPLVKAASPRLAEFNSFFGGVALLRPRAYAESWWGADDDSQCDTWKFCEGVRKHGKVVMDREAKVIWTEWF